MTIKANSDMSTDSETERYSSLWLNYQPLSESQRTGCDRVQYVYCGGNSAVLSNARDELLTALQAMIGPEIALTDDADKDGTVVIGTVQDLVPLISVEVLEKAKGLKAGGFVIDSIKRPDKSTTIITSNDDTGVLYGVFHFLRLIQTGTSIAGLSVVDEPAVSLRMLNHWDDLNGTIERGYAGKSLWKWDELPETLCPRYRDHARLCASVGINALVLNNVNADPRILRADYLLKVQALADVFREWGIQTYLSANFGAPMCPSETPDKMKRWGGVGNLDTADPLVPEVEAWWTNKVTEIYNLIPDFGGFLIKADSEGMPGPRSYDRTHVDGANMLARALQPHGGTLIWRAFVYGSSKDRALDAFNEFTPFDGQFLDNVILQIKNGPLDFQPCEPFNALFGSMPRTRLSIEFQVAKEYLGHASTVAYLGPMWSEVLNTDTYAEGENSTIARMLNGKLNDNNIQCIAGVTNTGNDADWCGNVFNPANWYAFGRLAWQPDLDPATIADEWIRMTFQDNSDTHQVIHNMMMGSYDAFVDYSMPMGLNFLCDWGHYNPKPDMRGAYHGADAGGLGVDRTTSGSNAVGQYHPERAAIWNDRDNVPLNYLLWFHHVPWDYPLSTGRTLWDEVNARYNGGVGYVDNMIDAWTGLEGAVSPELHASVQAKLTDEKKLACTWRDECLQYFSQFAESQIGSNNTLHVSQF